MTGMGNGERSNAYKEYTRNMSDLTPRMSESDFLASRNVENLSIGPSSIPLPEGMMIARGYVDTSPPETVTAEAERLTQAARHHSYGHPADDFAKVTGMALALWGRGPETPKEHAMYLILVKLSREAHEHKRDNLVDIAGYARTIEMIAERESGSLWPAVTGGADGIKVEEPR